MADGPSDIAGVYEASEDAPHPVWAILATYVPERPGLFAVGAVVAVVWRVAQLAPPYLIGVTLDTFLTSDQPGGLSLAVVPAAWVPATIRGQFLFVVGLFGGVVALMMVAHFVRFLVWRWFRQAVLHELRMDAYGAVQRLGMEFFVTERTGDVMSVLNNDINEFENFLGAWIRDVMQFAVFTGGLAVVMVLMHWQMAVVTFALLPVMLGLTFAYQRTIEPRYDERRSAVGALNARIENAISGVEAVKAATSEDRERERVAEHSRSYWRADWDVAKVGGTYYPLRDGVMRGTSLVVLLVGGWWALFGPPFGFAAPLSVGTFVAFYLYARNFVGHSARLGGLVDTYTDAKASAKRVYGLIHYPATVTEDPDATPLPSVDGRVEFRDVTFRYPDAEEPALREVSFAADAGEFVGLVGPTGAGKTTALKLLLRFYDPDEGIVAVDGHDITAVTLDSLRGAIGYVSQEPFLFDGTVRENIAYGDPGAEEADVVAASKRANAHEFVTDLPDGYDTRVGERGVKLSGGQRQRVAIARVVLEDPAILVLDEATSHVDNETELLIQESLAALVADRTTFAVAHRLSTVRDADHLVVIDDGEVVEQGTHEELLDADGLYATLWDVHVGNVAGLPEGLAGDAR